MSGSDQSPRRPSLDAASFAGRGAPAPAHLARAGDGTLHAVYRTARRAFCGLVVTDPAGKLGEPTCRTCIEALERMTSAGMVGSERTLATARHCGARTRRGRPCERAPLPCGYCPSHKHLAS